MKSTERANYCVYPIRLLALGKDIPERMNHITAYIVIRSGRSKIKSLGGIDDNNVERAMETRGIEYDIDAAEDWDDLCAFTLGSESVPGCRFDSLSDCMHWFNKGEAYLSQFEPDDKRAWGRVHPGLIAEAFRRPKAYRWLAFTSAIESIIGKHPFYQVHRKHLRARMMGYMSSGDIFGKDIKDEKGRQTAIVSDAGRNLLAARQDGAEPVTDRIAGCLLAKGKKTGLLARVGRGRKYWYSLTLNQKQLGESVAAWLQNKLDNRKEEEKANALVAEKINLFKTTAVFKTTKNGVSGCNAQSQPSENRSSNASSTRSSSGRKPGRLKHRYETPLLNTVSETPLNKTTPSTEGDSLFSNSSGQQMVTNAGQTQQPESTSSEDLEIEAHNREVLIEEQTADLQLEEICQAVVTNGLTDGAVIQALENGVKIETTLFLEHPDWESPLSREEARRCACQCSSGLEVLADQWCAENASREWNGESWKVNLLSWIIDKISELSGTVESPKPKEPDPQEPRVSIKEARAFAESLLKGAGHLGEQWQKVHGDDGKWAFIDWKDDCAKFVLNERERENKAKRQQALREVAA